MRRFADFRFFLCDTHFCDALVAATGIVGNSIANADSYEDDLEIVSGRDNAKHANTIYTHTCATAGSRANPAKSMITPGRIVAVCDFSASKFHRDTRGLVLNQPPATMESPDSLPLRSNKQNFRTTFQHQSCRPPHDRKFIILGSLPIQWRPQLGRNHFGSGSLPLTGLHGFPQRERGLRVVLCGLFSSTLRVVWIAYRRQVSG